MSSLIRNILAASTVVALAACSSGVKLNNGAGSANGAGANARSVAPVSAVDELNNPNSPLAQRSVFFDFDSYTVKDSYKSMLEAHAKYLIAHPNRHVLVQGNTDERGTSEYNLALGEKRAEAVVKVLELLGVPSSQLEAVSFGKEKPKALGHNEAAWAENRRADLAYQ
ncbi:membrane protein [Pandoraea thiooxydans]|uniref:Peptidoglycan-associated lipoprotein n=1 Tax=Pandoraea thiooxydans TaxID=445709 RepID=A0A0G3EVS4_9BURK|nr:peptidoglycan-associated lipoprotein Pal [Pandoraea thiooxydans]AKJ68856.1 peptidoglycan-associated lipoprotein [Pandoraea thiooxydans]APR96338.1 membrane protein [Pandoraea thiooxydans]